MMPISPHVLAGYLAWREKYAKEFDESKHPRAEDGKFGKGGSGEGDDKEDDADEKTVSGGNESEEGENVEKGDNKTQGIIDLLGIDPETYEEIQKPGVWFRSQPKGLGLDHRTETSEGELADGLHVFQNLEQVLTQEGDWICRKEKHEIIVIDGPVDLADSGDVEGWVLPGKKGKIIGRFDFCDLSDEYNDS